MPRLKPPDKLWYPTLLQSANNIHTNAWFDMKEICNNDPNYIYTKPRKNKEIEYLKTIKIPLYPNKYQKDIILKWFIGVIEAYNITNQYIKNNINSINFKNLSIKELRPILNSQLLAIKNKTKNINKHILDYAVSHCIAMYKSANTNLQRHHINHYDIKDLDINRNRYNLVVEPNNISKKSNSIFPSILGDMKSEYKINKNKLKHNCILQYHKNTDRFYLLAPVDKVNIISKDFKKHKKCGVDLGIRTFASIYTPDKVIEIGNNNNRVLDRYHNKIDKLKSEKDRNILKEKLYNHLKEKYGNKMRNRISDLHKKTAVYLVRNFKDINLGKFSSKIMISKTKSNLKETVKRRCLTLSFYKFNEFIKIMGKKYNSEVHFINEYKTSMTCHCCKNENKNVGQSKIYNCTKSTCKITLGRDVNASINIYNGGLLRV